MQTIYIPDAIYNNLAETLHARITAITPEVDGSTAHKIMEALSEYGIFPASLEADFIEPGVTTSTEPDFVEMTPDDEVAIKGR